MYIVVWLYIVHSFYFGAPMLIFCIQNENVISGSIVVSVNFVDNTINSTVSEKAATELIVYPQFPINRLLARVNKLLLKRRKILKSRLIHLLGSERSQNEQKQLGLVWVLQMYQLLRSHKTCIRFANFYSRIFILNHVLFSHPDKMWNMLDLYPSTGTSVNLVLQLSFHCLEHCFTNWKKFMIDLLLSQLLIPLPIELFHYTTIKCKTIANVFWPVICWLLSHDPLIT